MKNINYVSYCFLCRWERWECIVLLIRTRTYLALNQRDPFFWTKYSSNLAEHWKKMMS
jgi:hypothetical protein